MEIVWDLQTGVPACMGKKNIPKARQVVYRAPQLLWEIRDLPALRNNSEFITFHASSKTSSLVHSEVDLFPSSTNSVFLLSTMFREDMAE